jgi:hypothetical protein
MGMKGDQTGQAVSPSGLLQQLSDKILMPTVNAVKGPDGQNSVFIQVNLG